MESYSLSKSLVSSPTQAPQQLFGYWGVRRVKMDKAAEIPVLSSLIEELRGLLGAEDCLLALKLRNYILSLEKTIND